MAASPKEFPTSMSGDTKMALVPMTMGRRAPTGPTG
jgi:hypothetical protein